MNNKGHRNCLDCVFYAADGYWKHRCTYFNEPIETMKEFEQAKTCEQYSEHSRD